MPRAKAVDEAEVVRQALVKEHAARHSQVETVPVANGNRLEVNVAVEPRYNGMDATTMLGDPASILSAPNPACKYVWKRKTDKQTAAWIRAGILRPVTPDEVDTSNPLAEFVEDVLPGGAACVTWETLALFEMQPKWVAKIYEAPEQWALQRLAQNGAEFAGKVQETTGGAYAGTFKVSGNK